MWKLWYRKDRAMRPIRGCPKNFRGSLTMPTATIPRIFHGLLFRWMFLQNLLQKSEALPVPEIIWGTQKFFAAPWYAYAPFSPNFYGLLFGLALKMYSPNLKSVALHVPEIIGDTQKIGQPLHTPTLHFLQNFYWAFIWIGAINVSAKFEVRSFTCSWDKRG